MPRSDTHRLNPMVQEDKMCRSKRRYESVDDIRANAKPSATCALYAYQCPYCNGLHLTKFIRPIDPQFKDRVNIEIYPKEPK